MFLSLLWGRPNAHFKTRTGFEKRTRHFAPDVIQTCAGGLRRRCRSLAEHYWAMVYLRLVGRFDSLRAFLPPPPPLFLSAEFLAADELLFFLPFFTTSHFPTEPLFEAISAFQNRVSVAARGFCDFLRFKESWQSSHCETAGGAGAHFWLVSERQIAKEEVTTSNEVLSI